MHLRYLSYLLRHKWYVFPECCKLGTATWYLERKDKLHLHPDTRAWFEARLGIVCQG